MARNIGVDPDPPRSGRSSPAVVFVALIAGTIGLAVVANTVGAAATQRPSRTPTVVASTPSGQATTRDAKEREVPSIGGLALGGQEGHAFLAFRDASAVNGAWTVAVRRADGSLGQHGAVVTYPAPGARDTDTGVPIRVGPESGVSRPGVIIWSLGNGHARIRGDLAQADLLRLAERTSVVAGRPHVIPPEGFRVVAVAPSRLPLVHEIRYGSDWLGVRVAPGDGLTYTALTTGGGFEDALFAAGAASAGRVHGMPAVVSPVHGGTVTLAWEPEPGTVAYLGWSGADMSPKVVHSLRVLAETTYVLTPGQWLATSPDLTEQENSPAN